MQVDYKQPLFIEEPRANLPWNEVGEFFVIGDDLFQLALLPKILYIIRNFSDRTQVTFEVISFYKYHCQRFYSVNFMFKNCLFLELTSLELHVFLIIVVTKNNILSGSRVSG